MSEIFLSASVPVKGRGPYFDDSDPFLIQMAVRELVTVTIRKHRIVWGGHPAITPMIWAICEDLEVGYSHAVTLYQSRYFEADFPQENQEFANIALVDAVENDRAASLNAMRKAMLSRTSLAAAVFIGGMEGIVEEYNLFRRFHPMAKVVAVAAPGGAARTLGESRGDPYLQWSDAVDFGTLFRQAFA